MTGGVAPRTQQCAQCHMVQCPHPLSHNNLPTFSTTSSTYIHTRKRAGNPLPQLGMASFFFFHIEDSTGCEENLGVAGNEHNNPIDTDSVTWFRVSSLPVKDKRMVMKLGEYMKQFFFHIFRLIYSTFLERVDQTFVFHTAVERVLGMEVARFICCYIGIFNCSGYRVGGRKDGTGHLRLPGVHGVWIQGDMICAFSTKYYLHHRVTCLSPLKGLDVNGSGEDFRGVVMCVCRVRMVGSGGRWVEV